MDSSSLSSVQILVEKIKGEMLRDMHDPYSFIATSAYDTAWLAMVPDHASLPLQPMFKVCLDWVLNNQNESGFWGECDGHGLPTIECLPATIACMIALKKWNVGDILIDKGMAFIEANAENLLGQTRQSCPRWFSIVFPAIVELADTCGLDFGGSVKGLVMDISCERQQIPEREPPADKYHYPPLLSYLEVLPSDNIDGEVVSKQLDNAGSLYQSPSATASAFMATGNKDCLAYLQSLIRKFSGGVPPTYPVDEEMIKLCLVNQIQRLGLADYFNQEIEGLLEQVYRKYKTQEYCEKPYCAKPIDSSIGPKLYKDSLAFLLLRMHGYRVSPGRFCWFLHDGEIQDIIENNHEYFSSAMLNVYRATDLMFPGEYELEEARSFSRKILEKTMPPRTIDHQENKVSPSCFLTTIEHELRAPWITRLDHLEHRLWIEEKNNNALWMGKTSLHRLSCFHNEQLMQLALQNFKFRQSIYQKELEELKKWSHRWGLTDMGFGREKTAYCYFAVSAATSLPWDSDVRMIAAKSGIVITVADDFYDMEGSLDELKKLTDAIQRWDGKGLKGHGKTIFDVLESLVGEMAEKHLQQQGYDITDTLRDIWYETFLSWFTESSRSINACIPSAEDYLATGMVSIATHTITLPASCFLNPALPAHKLKPAEYETITKLLMVTTRLLNDTQSYEKEQIEGKTNFVLLCLKENPEADIEDCIAYVREMLDKKNKEFLKHALMEGFDDLSKPCRHLHLSALKVFQMFFDSGNRYDSNRELVQDIQNAIYVPPRVEKQQPLELPALHSGSARRHQTVVSSHFDRWHPKHHSVSSTGKIVFHAVSRVRYANILMPLKLGLCFA